MKDDEPMKDDGHDATQWPPPPTTHFNVAQKPTNHLGQRLLAGTLWADVLLGMFISLILFTFLTFVLANPLAYSVLPKRLPSQFRLLGGWFLANVVLLVGWIIPRRKHYNVFSQSVMWTSIFASLFWLFIILLAWRMFG